MNNPTPVRFELPPYLLDELEFCVRAYEACQALPAGAPEAEAQIAFQDYWNKAVAVVSIMMVEMRGLPLGTLGEALEMAARNREARVAAAAANFSVLPVTP
ncbi:hypothetical protein [Pseudomonas hunanensis]|uniref:hypothetical protein n=1 Tax=Pseudomonas hunanensis TaxID=1247546 RepID=UPI0030DD33AE